MEGFSGGEVVPRTSEIEFFVAFALLAGCTIVNAVLIGYMASYAEELTKDSTEFQGKLNRANSAMINLELERLMCNIFSKVEVCEIPHDCEFCNI